MDRHRFVAWDKVDDCGTEAVDVFLEQDRFSARGVAIGWQPLTYVLESSLETNAGWVTSRIQVRTHGEGWERRLDLRRSSAGVWSIEAAADGNVDLPPPGGDAAAFVEAVDCDLGLSPLTNSMPVLRHGLLERDGTHEFVMAWVSVPDLSVHASGQRYSTKGEYALGLRVIEYSSMQRDFVSELTFDADGLVVDYPQLARRVPTDRADAG
jgi:hypothetical protein